MRDINSIIDRMKQVTNSRTDAELIKYLGLKSNNSVSTWKTRNRIPYPECDQISQKENVDIGYLLTGKQVGASIFPKPLTGHIVTPATSDLMTIPEYDQQLSAGIGAYPDDHALAIGSRPFSGRWLLKKGLKAQNLKLLRVMGDSMEPLLKDKDMVMIDTSKTTPTEAMPFAVRLGGELFVKGIQRQGGGTLLLVSRNSAYTNITISGEYPPDDFSIIGAVVWHAHSWV